MVDAYVLRNSDTPFDLLKVIIAKARKPCVNRIPLLIPVIVLKGHKDIFSGGRGKVVGKKIVNPVHILFAFQ